MQPPGSFKIAHRRTSTPDVMDRLAPGEARVRRIVDSLRAQLSAGEARDLRIRQIFDDPREIFRLEYALSGVNAQRTTLLDRDTLDELLDTDAVRAALDPGYEQSRAEDF